MTKKSLILTALLTLATSVQVAFAGVTVPGTPDACTKASTWQNPKGDVVVATPARIAEINKSMLSDRLFELDKYPTTIDKATLQKYLDHFSMDYNQYVNGKKLQKGWADGLVKDANSNIPTTANVQYGVVVARNNMRSFPTLQQAFSKPEDHDFDNWQETAVDPGEPVLILHQNAKKDFSFVQMKCYRGWIETNKIALTNRDGWLQYVNPQDFAVVTDKLVAFKGKNNANWLYQMGDRIPVDKDGKLILPMRTTDGLLANIEANSKWDNRLHKGYLPYTTNNIVAMAFKHLGAQYGWGGLKNSVDCSGLTQDVYKTVGIQLNRNASEQRKAFKGLDFTGMNKEQRERTIKALTTGSLLFSPGHVMLYLGTYNNKPYMIHSVGSYGIKNAKGGYDRKSIMHVIVSDVDLMRANGITLMMQMQKVNTYK